MEAEAVAKEDDIEECSEDEGEARPSANSTPAGVAGRFASYLAPRQPEDGLQAGITEFETSREIGPGPPPQVDGIDIQGGANDDSLFAPFLNGNDDGTFTGGPAGGDELADFRQEEPLAVDGAAMADTAAVGEDDGSSDAGEADAVEAAAMAGTEEPPLPEEAWKDRTAAERELWERVRPRALRREAARTKELKLPNAAVNRLMRVHPDLQTKSSEALEIINYATVLMVQAMAQASVRGRKATGQTVRLEDIKQVCLKNKELQFLLPLSATLDASALAIVHQIHEDEVATGKAAGSARVVAAAPGQSTLNSTTFARNAGSKPAQEVAEATEEGALDVVSVLDNLDPKAKTPQAKQGNKRKLPPSGKSAAAKAPRQSNLAGEKPAASAGGGIASFFKRPETQTS